MSWTKVREDEHGLLVRTNCTVFRPEKSRYESDYTERRRIIEKGTAFLKGQRVWVSGIAQSTLCRVVFRASGYRELWTSHGGYYDGLGNIISTEQAWCPPDPEMKKYKVTWTEKHEFETEATSKEDAMDEACDMGQETFIEGSDSDLKAVEIK